MACSARPQRCGTHPLRTLEAGCTELIFQGEIEVLRTSLTEDVLASVPSRSQLLDRLLGADVYDVERSAGQVRDHDRAMRGLFLHLPSTSNSVIVGRGPPRGVQLLGKDIDRRAVLGMHHGQQPSFG